MAALLAVFAEFEREILRERVRAGLALARQNGKRLGPTHSSGDKSRGSAGIATCRHQQGRNRPHLGSPHSGVTYFPEK
jgi:DNA invertase Pin-like site-specific DNA recombinase